ncbi:MAG: aminoacyl-tRNA hydrolase [Gemmatimonadetes bacterium]|nr:aminoacyl-tRNA hydrolase [Gemmatimonadota bacterium]NIO30794.1 aminoacyl-tRNA hydrolase [Gemmatimonadota bacterium]
MLKALVGLGNPGARYDATRHNVGWWLVDLLKRRWSATPFQEEDLWLRSRAELSEVGEVWLIKPLTYMNRSGIAVRALLEYEPLDLEHDVLIVVDDVALEPGRPRFRARGSAGNHNGLQSIEDVLGTREYARLRIGVGAPPAGVELADWVLSEFDDPEDEDAVLELLPRLSEAVELWAREGVEAAMNRYNAPLSDDE